MSSFSRQSPTRSVGPDHRNRSLRPPIRSAGFTLVELLVVLVILGLLAGLVGPQVMGYLGSAKTDSARLQIEQFSASLDLFRLDVGRYPSSDEGLEALVANVSTSDKWRGPYLRKKDVPLDPWGNAYRYRAPGENGLYDLFSLGADNAEGGEGEDGDVRSE